MTTTRTFYKNSNTGTLIKKVSFSDLSFKVDDNFYDFNGKPLENPCLKGFVEISQKKFERQAIKQRKLNK